MKTKLFLVATVLFFLSCEKEVLDSNYSYQQHETKYPTTRSQDQSLKSLNQLRDIPVTITSASTGKFLSGNNKGHVTLENTDDKSKRQHWYITETSTGYSISLIGSNNYAGAYLSRTNKNAAGLTFLNTSFTISNKNDYHYTISNIIGGWFDGKAYVLEANDNESRFYEHPLFEGSSNFNAYWTVKPVEDFIIKSIKYNEPISSDKVILTPYFLSSMPLKNYSDREVEQTISFSQDVTITSSFSETENIKVSTVNNYTTSTPEMEGGTVNTTVTSENSTSYTTNTTTSTKANMNVSASIKVPKYSEYTIKFVGVHYKVTLPYTIELEGCLTHKKIYLSGQWIGEEVHDFQFEFYGKEGNLINSMDVSPQRHN